MTENKMNQQTLKEVTENEDKLRQYIHLLSEANTVARLTGPSDETVLWNDHLLDCAAALPYLPKTGRVIDVGTGGGLPGIVWAVCRPELDVVLLDSIAKKCALVEKIAKALNLQNVTVVCSRSEDYAKQNSEKFHVAAARAVCAAGILAEYLAPLVRIRGKAIAFKGPRAAEELQTVGNKWNVLGFSSPRLEPYTLGEMKRYIMVWDKVAHTTKGIPRKPGMAEKFPWYTKK